MVHKALAVPIATAPDRPNKPCSIDKHCAEPRTPETRNLAALRAELLAVAARDSPLLESLLQRPARAHSHDSTASPASPSRSTLHHPRARPVAIPKPRVSDGQIVMQNGSTSTQPNLWGNNIHTTPDSTRLWLEKVIDSVHPRLQMSASPSAPLTPRICLQDADVSLSVDQPASILCASSPSDSNFSEPAESDDLDEGASPLGSPAFGAAQGSLRHSVSVTFADTTTETSGSGSGSGGAGSGTSSGAGTSVRPGFPHNKRSLSIDPLLTPNMILSLPQYLASSSSLAPPSSAVETPPSLASPPAPGGPATRPVLNRYYSTPMNPMSPARQHFRLHNPVPHHVKETPTIKILEDARGKFVNQYQITRVVGRGSFGMVYLAVDPQGQRYALKECSKRRLAKLNRAALMRLRRQIVTRGNVAPTAGEISSLITREIAVMKKLDHPNLVTLYEVLDDPNSESLILVLEWCPKGTIMPAEEDYDGKAKPIGEQRSRLYFRDLVLGVEYLHERGVCHRDIKADNVLLGEGDVVKIADFGVSEIFDLTKNQEDNVQRPVGSPAYMSPELVWLQCGTSVASSALDHGGETSQTAAINGKNRNLHPAHAPVSGRKADIWAMGVTLYYMVHGRLPFEANNISGLHESILTTEPDVSECTPELAHLFKRIFAKSPADRITLRELRDHPWVTQNGLDPLLPVEENVQVSEFDKITEEDLRSAIEQIEHRPGAPRLDYRMVSKSLRTNYGWHGSTTASEASSGARTPRQEEWLDGVSPSQHSSPSSLKMEKLSRALEELFQIREQYS